MRILYGIQGTGNGHTTRARAMAKAFKKYNVDVDYLFSGRDPELYFDMEEFGQYQTRTGLTFVTCNGKVNSWQTLRQAKVGQFFKDVKKFMHNETKLVLIEHPHGVTIDDIKDIIKDEFIIDYTETSKYGWIRDIEYRTIILKIKNMEVNNEVY